MIPVSPHGEVGGELDQVKPMWGELAMEQNQQLPHGHFVPTTSFHQVVTSFERIVACVAWWFLSGESAITNPKVARSLGERSYAG